MAHFSFTRNLSHESHCFIECISIFYFSDVISNLSYSSFCFVSFRLSCVWIVMSSAFETLLEAARYIELQEQRERLTSASSTSTSSSTSPYSRYQSNKGNNQNYSSSTPPASPLSDGQRNHNEYTNGGSTIIRAGKIIYVWIIFIILTQLNLHLHLLFALLVLRIKNGKTK